MTKGIVGMDMEFLSILRNMRSITSLISVNRSQNIRNKISVIGKQHETFSGPTIAITICMCTVCALSFFIMSVINTPNIYAVNTIAPIVILAP